MFFTCNLHHRKALPNGIDGRGNYTCWLSSVAGRAVIASILRSKAMKVRALRPLAIAIALFAPIPSGAQQKPDGVTWDECKKSSDRPCFVKELLNQDIPGVPGKRVRVTQIVLGPQGATGLHVHPGDEYGTVVEGPLRLQRGCAAYQPAGNSFSVPRGPSMNVKNETDKPAMLISILIIDANKDPLTYVKECRD
jgi:quercetin dioxygenase-like cupin family protein